MQKTLVVDDALTGVHATHEVSERGIVYFESVTENASRCGIDGTFDLATLTAHRYRLSKAIEAKIRTLGRIQKRKALEEFLFRNDSAVFYVSGGHFNPAVTVGLCTARRFLGRDVIPYVLAQVAGAIAVQEFFISLRAAKLVSMRVPASRRMATMSIRPGVIR